MKRVVGLLAGLGVLGLAGCSQGNTGDTGWSNGCYGVLCVNSGNGNQNVFGDPIIWMLVGIALFLFLVVVLGGKSSGGGGQ